VNVRDTRHVVQRLPLLILIAVAAALILPAAVSAAGRGPTLTAGPDSSVAGPCTRKVKGFTAAAVERARDLAGRGGIVCFPAGTYTGDLHATVARQTWKLDNKAVLTGSVYITGAKFKLLNGIITRPGDNRWIASVEIRAHDVTVQSVIFNGGGAGIGVYGVDRSRIVSNTFKRLTGSAISIWSEGIGADYTLISKNTIVQTRTFQVSPIMSRGNEGGSPGGVQNYRTLVTGNKIDQGQGDVGWFGIELKQSRLATIVGNTIRGGRVLISLPETNKAQIRKNTFDLRGSPDWGIEVNNAHDANITGNRFLGDGIGGADYAIAVNTDSQRITARRNTATNIRTFIGVAGDGHRITDNCLKKRVRFVEEFMQNGGPNIVIARNRSC
jgi:hypothetical protein